MQRRNFIKISSLASATFMLGFSKSAGAKIQNLSLANLQNAELSPFISIEKSGKITLVNIKPDMGQGTFQSIPALIAEELEVDLAACTILQSGGEKKFGGGQSSGGSYSVRGSYFDMRKIGASAREMLVKAAAQTWSVAENECFAENAHIIHRPTGKKLGYGELAALAATFPVPEKPTLKSEKDFKILGKNQKRPDILWKTTGKPIFGIDQTCENMAYASVERCPVFGGKLVKFDDRAALKISGVRKVVAAERVFGKNIYPVVAVIADNYWAAQKGRKALQIEWDFQGNDAFNSVDYEKKLRERSSEKGLIAANLGDFQSNFDKNTQKLTAFYETPFVSHSPMEPMNCLAKWSPDGQNLELWLSTQAPDWILEDLSVHFKIKAENIKINVAFNGGGFGRRLFPDVAAEAASIAKAAGQPVKVIWSREDDTQQGPFRPLSFSAMQAAISPEKRIAAWSHKVISPSIEATFSTDYDRSKPDGTMLEATHEQAYEIENLQTAHVLAEIPVPLGYWRAVTSATLAFAHECFMDELATLAGRDPLDFRLDHLQKDTATRKIFLKLKEMSGHGKTRPSGNGLGFAQYDFFAGTAGAAVEVEKKSDNSLKIKQIWVAIDLGTVVNPDVVRSQIEGAVAMALTAATKNGITFERGRAVQSNFHDNPMLRLPEMPPVEVHIFADGGEKIKGVGEPGLPPIAPALANAIFAATGRRIRRMPFDI